MVRGTTGAGPETVRVGVETIGLGVMESSVDFLCGVGMTGLGFVAVGLFSAGSFDLTGSSLAGVRGRGAGATIGVGGTDTISSATDIESWLESISSPPIANRSSSSCRFRSS